MLFKLNWSFSVPRFGNVQQKPSKAQEPRFKDVLCLLPSPEYDTVPRGKAKTKLIEQGLYVDSWPFQKSYNERELKAEMSSLLNKRLVNKDGKEVR